VSGQIPASCSVRGTHKAGREPTTGRFEEGIGTPGRSRPLSPLLSFQRVELKSPTEMWGFFHVRYPESTIQGGLGIVAGWQAQVLFGLRKDTFPNPVIARSPWTE